ncbi:heparinase II/III family protein [Gammaproteobacteria bacterium AB-CW1]|uniref:Heparinase II/III family protein n=1 Tax=Natronospira elongata TaxID=3110268 RepID=A0AAP6MMP7_9GAMM|nr:heparinase II/III family protein [Gammaproteobacteria bacterium AB-CW1]
MDVLNPDRIPPIKDFDITASKDPAKELADQRERGFVAKGREDLAPVKLDVPTDWTIKPYRDRNWMFQFHAWRSFDPACYLIAEGGERGRAEAEWVVSEMAGWWRQAPSPRRRNKWAWYDMAVGLRAQKIALVLIALRYHGWQDLLEQDVWAPMIEAHLKRLTDPKELNPGNHGLFQLNGLMALLWAWPDANDRVERIHYTERQMLALLHDQLGEHGVHREHSPHYHFFIVRTIEKVLGAPWWESADMTAIQDLVHRAHVAARWLVDPQDCCIPVGDSTDARIRVRDPSDIREWPHVENDGALGAIVDGYGVIRSTPEAKSSRRSLLFVQAGFFGRTHKHADCLSLVWQERGENLLVDSGKYGYNSGPMRNYMKSARAHNSVEVDGKSLSTDARDAYGNAMETVEPLGAGWLMRADMHRPEADFRHRRTVLYMPRRTLVVLDELVSTGKAGRRFTGWWQCNPDHHVGCLAPDQLLVTGLKRDRAMTMAFFAEGVREAPRFETWLGRERPEPQGWVSTGYLEARPTTSIACPVQAEDRRVLLATVFVIRSNAPRNNSARVERRKGKLTLVGGGSRYFSGDDKARTLDLEPFLEDS